jgi:uncharacterized membrane protein YhaH (DUF805 family)
MTFGQAIKHVFSNYANFNGRASRSEFWWFYLFSVIVNFVIYLISLPLGLTIGGQEMIVGEGANATAVAIPGFPILGLIWFLAIIIPTLAVGTRRFHDSGRSAWNWLFILLAPLCGIGSIILLILWILPGTAGPNNYGDGPAQPV